MSIDDPAQPRTARPGGEPGAGPDAAPAAGPATEPAAPESAAPAPDPAPRGPAPGTEPGGGPGTEPDLDPATGSAAPLGPAPRTRTLGPAVLRLHFYAGLLIAPFLLVAAVTGFLYAASYQIEQVVHADELTVPVPDSTSTLPLSAQVEAAVAAHPGKPVSQVWPSAEDGATTRVLLADPALGTSRTLAVFVDPYTAEVRGDLVSYGSSGALPVRAWISELHRHLHLGEPGRFYSELAASWLWVVALGGLFLWLRRRRETRGPVPRARGLLLPERGLRGHRRFLSWHGSVGIWAVLGLLFLSATGLTWSTYAGAQIGELREQLRGATPAVTATVEPGGPAGGGHEGHGEAHGDGGHRPGAGADIGLDRLMDITAEQRLDGPMTITVPAEENGAYVVAEADKQWPVRLDAVSVHPMTGEVVDSLAFADFPLLAQLSRFGIDAHMGLFLGLPNQLLLMALATGLVVLIVLGYRMWWQRRPVRDTGFRAARPPVARGAWRRTPVHLLLPLLAAAAVAGWYLPLFGSGLLLFLAVDGVWGAVARRRDGTRTRAEADGAG